MSISLTPFVVRTEDLNKAIGTKKKEHTLYHGLSCWHHVNQTIKKWHGISGVTGKMIYEDIVSQNFRFLADNLRFVYTLGLEAMITMWMERMDLWIYYAQCDLKAGREMTEESRYLASLKPITNHFYKGRQNDQWVPCNREVINHLPLKYPINIPHEPDYFVSTIYNKDFDGFLSNLDLSDCTDEAGEKQFRGWFDLAKQYHADVVMIVW